jgi:hypothetical protein
MHPDPRSLNDLRCEIRDRTLAFRCIERIIATEQFEEAYRKAKPICKEEVEGFIKAGDRDKLECWVRKQLNAEYGEMTIRELRRIAQRFGVPLYNRLPKASLLSEITHYAKADHCIDGSGEANLRPA